MSVQTDTDRLGPRRMRPTSRVYGEDRLARFGFTLEARAGPLREVPALMSMIGANVGVLSPPAKHDHRLLAEEHDHCLSTERIATAAVALCAFASRYVDLLADEVSPADRRRLSEAAALMERACDSVHVVSGALRE